MSYNNYQFTGGIVGTGGNVIFDQSFPQNLTNIIPLSLASTATGGIKIHNLPDEITNSEYISMGWSGNIALFQTQTLGTGLTRSLSFRAGNGNSIFTQRAGASAAGSFQFQGFVTNNINTTTANFLSTSTATGGLNIGALINQTYNQLGATSNTALKIQNTEILVGSGAQNLIDTFAGTGGIINEWTLNNKGKITNYAATPTTGWGHPAIYAAGRSTAQTAAVNSVSAYTVGSSDGSFIISANVNVTAATTNSFTVTCTYTDETNTSRVLTLTFSNLSGTLIQTITNVTGTGAYEGVPLHIRAKAGTTITFATVGTFTSVTYNVEGVAQQIA